MSRRRESFAPEASVVQVLQIVEGAHRSTRTEQDDPVVWIAHALKGAGANLNVLLQGDAVRYATKRGHPDSPARRGHAQLETADVAQEIEKLLQAGVRIYVVAEDAAARRLDARNWLAGVRPVSASELPALLAAHDQLWMW
jgi:hypothetical protein